MDHNHLFMEQCHFVKGLDPVADAFDTAPRSDVVSLRDWEKILFIVRKGVGTTGTSTITVEASDDVVPTNKSAVPFYYRAYTGAIGTSDAAGAITLAPSTGFTTTAGSSQAYLIEIDCGKLLASGYQYVSLLATEVVNSPVLGGIDIILLNPRFGGTAAPRTVIA